MRGTSGFSILNEEFTFSTSPSGGIGGNIMITGNNFGFAAFVGAALILWLLFCHFVLEMF